MGPGIGRSGFRSASEFGDASFGRYQTYVNDAYDVAVRLESQGLLTGSANTRIGNYVDRISRARFDGWLASEGIQEGHGGLLQANRWLLDPQGSGTYVRPDIRIPGAGLTLDATVGWKWGTDTQTMRFGSYSGDRITIVRPQQLGGSYSIWP